MDPNVACQLLLFADNVDAPQIYISNNVLARSDTTAVLEFLIRQEWIVRNDDLWSITPTGRLWIRSVEHHYELVKFHEYGGETFLVHTRSNQDELIVWHSSSFVTITPATSRFHSPGPYLLKRDAEFIATSAGPNPEDALAAACRMLVEVLDVPEPLQEANAGFPHTYQLRRFLEGL